MSLFDPSLFDPITYETSQAPAAGQVSVSTGTYRPEYEPALRGIQIVFTVPFEIRIKEYLNVIAPSIIRVSSMREELHPTLVKVGSASYSSAEMVEHIGAPKIQEAKIKVRSLGSDVSERLKKLETLKKLITLKTRMGEDVSE